MTGTALVTGASGGLGLALVAALSHAGRPVVAVGRRAATDPRLVAAPGVRYVRADLTDATVARTLCDEVTTVFHLAALSSPWGPRRAFERTNVAATRHLLAHAAHAGTRTFVYASSPSIYTATHDRIGLAEDDPPAARPLNHYARTKLEAERLVLAADGAMRTVVIRPRAIVGPDDAVLLPRLMNLIERRRAPLPGGGRARVEFTDVRDVAAALLLAERHAARAHGHAINISGGQPVRVRDVASALAAAVGRDLHPLALPLPLLRLLARINEVAHTAVPALGEPRLTRYALATLACSQTFDLARARRLLGWHPEHDALATLVEEARRGR